MSKIRTCPRCGYNGNNLKQHFKRKNICKPTLLDIPIEECIEYVSIKNIETTLRNFGDENMEHIDADYLGTTFNLVNCKLDEVVMSIFAAIFFHPEHPENNNIRIPNPKKNIISVYVDGHWEERNKDECLEEIYSRITEIVDNFLFNYVLTKENVEKYLDSRQKTLDDLNSKSTGSPLSTNG